MSTTRRGKLAAGIVKRMLPAESSVMIGCDTLRYALWVEVGNGPEGGRIFPVHSKVLRFTSGGQVFFRASVRTSKPTRYLLGRFLSGSYGLSVKTGIVTSDRGAWDLLN